MSEQTTTEIASLTDRVKRLERELQEYIRAEAVLIAGGYVRESKVEEAHAIVRDLLYPS